MHDGRRILGAYLWMMAHHAIMIGDGLLHGPAARGLPPAFPRPRAGAAAAVIRTDGRRQRTTSGSWRASLGSATEHLPKAAIQRSTYTPSCEASSYAPQHQLFLLSL